MGTVNAGRQYANALAAELRGQLIYEQVQSLTLSEHLGVGPSSISQWLHSRSSIPFWFTYAACTTLGGNVTELFDIAEVRMSTPTPRLITTPLEPGIPARNSPLNLREQGIIFADCIAVELKVRIKAQGYSIWEMGPKAGFSRSAGGHWLNGKHPVPVPFAYNTCVMLGLKIGHLTSLAEARMSQFVRLKQHPDQG